MARGPPTFRPAPPSPGCRTSTSAAPPHENRPRTERAAVESAHRTLGPQSPGIRLLRHTAPLAIRTGSYLPSGRNTLRTAGVGYLRSKAQLPLAVDPGNRAVAYIED